MKKDMWTQGALPAAAGNPTVFLGRPEEEPGTSPEAADLLEELLRIARGEELSLLQGYAGF